MIIICFKVWGLTKKKEKKKENKIMQQFSETSDRKQEWCMPKERAYQVLKRNSAIPIRLDRLPPLSCW